MFKESVHIDDIPAHSSVCPLLWLSTTPLHCSSLHWRSIILLNCCNIIQECCVEGSLTGMGGFCTRGCAWRHWTSSWSQEAVTRNPLPNPSGGRQAFPPSSVMKLWPCIPGPRFMYGSVVCVFIPVFMRLHTPKAVLYTLRKNIAGCSRLMANGDYWGLMGILLTSINH